MIFCNEKDPALNLWGGRSQCHTSLYWRTSWQWQQRHNRL